MILSPSGRLLERRRLLAGGLAVSAAALVGGCGESADSDLAFSPWNGPEYDPDPRVRLVGWACLAPSFRNSQPWLVELDPDGNSLRLYVDSDRLHLASDPDLRMVSLSLGAFLECFDIAAPMEGRRAFITLAPDGPLETIDDLRRKPVALARLSAANVDPPHRLFPFLRKRRSSTRAFLPRAIANSVSACILEQARSAGGGGVGWVDRGPTMERVRVICGEALRREVSTPSMATEFSADVRLSRTEVARHRDGIVPTPYWIGEAIRLVYGQHAFAEVGSFLNRSLLLRAAQWMESAAAFGWITTKGDGYKQRLTAGRTLARLALAAAERGVATQPLSSATCAAPAMDDLRAEVQETLAAPGEVVHSIARFGYAPTKDTATPRRSAQDFLKKV